ncbi:MAG TPA: ATP-dependent helicase, partial [Acidimicrobiales bacterium]|nr:ATP-dependent helicase [Acidimicrobiales bacterium]
MPRSPVSGGHEQLLADCDDEQRLAITSDDAPLFVRAGAGSGKTRVLTRRVAWRIAEGSAAAGHTLVATFTRKAASELRQRLSSLGAGGPVTAGTLHAIALAELRRLALDRGRSLPVVLDRRQRLLERLAAEGALPVKGREGLAALVAEIDWAKARLVDPAGYAAAATRAERRSPLEPEVVAECFSVFELEKHRRGLLDFDDLLRRLAEEIAGDPDLAAAQRWRFRHLYVDEFQDLNPAQLRLLEAWLGDNRDICVVGDPDQAVYGWNGSDPAIMTTIERRWPAVATIRLDTNYRSTPQVLALGRAALSGGGGRSTLAAVPRSSRGDGPVPSVTAYSSGAEEASRVAAALRRAHAPGRLWSQLAVLARTNAQLVAFQEACAAVGIPHRVGGSTSFLQRSAVREFLRRAAAQPSSDAFGRLVADLEEVSAGPGPELETEEDLERRLDLAALARLCRDYETFDPGGGGAGFAAWARGELRGEASSA